MVFAAEADVQELQVLSARGTHFHRLPLGRLRIPFVGKGLGMSLCYKKIAHCRNRGPVDVMTAEVVAMEAFGDIMDGSEHLTLRRASLERSLDVN